MPEPVQNDGVWWVQQADGKWLWWDERAQQWRPYKAVPDKGVEAQWFPVPGGGTLPVVRRGSWSGRFFRAPRETYKPFRLLTGWLIAVSILTAVLYVALFAIDLSVDQRDVLFDFDTATNEEIQLAVAEAIASVALLLHFVMLIVWVRRAYRNLGPLGVGWLRFKAGWAVGAWFVPLLNLIRPKEIINDIWRASQPDANNVAGTPSLGAPVWPLINLWWTASILSGLFFGPVDRPIPMSALLQVMASAVLIPVVLRILDAQEARARNAIGPPPPPPLAAEPSTPPPPPSP